LSEPPFFLASSFLIVASLEALPSSAFTGDISY
jgi:hypothetical protein